MPVLVWILIFALVGSVGSVVLAGAFLLSPEKVRRILISILLSFAAGTLLGAAFLVLIPEAAEALPVLTVLTTVVIGILAFFVLEKLVLIRHCHGEQCDIYNASGPLILVGDAFHNFVDGVVIAAAFLVSIPTGIAASIAVVAHEIPQELGDFAILLDHGYAPRRALFWNVISGLATLPGAIIAYFALSAVEFAVPYTLSVAAASFLYISMADLIPSLHRRTHPKLFLGQLGLITAGIAVVTLLGLIHH